MPDALETDCSKCSPKQKEGSEKIVRYIINNKPDYWKELQEKYDPNDEYEKRYIQSELKQDKKN